MWYSVRWKKYAAEARAGRGWSLGSGAKGEGSAVREGPGQDWAWRGRGNSKFVMAVGTAHLTGVRRMAGTGKQGWRDPGSAMPSTGRPGSPGPVLGQLAPTISPKGSDLCWTLVREPGRASTSDHPSCGPQERRELEEPCQARARPATEAQILQFDACPAPQ